ncbi:hypothetical protein C8R44DRAFT_877596 [Mycena epipterygia]|nr:hypothetical protein C8R44DRAFT_877596 [Mycena epipterygia]
MDKRDDLLEPPATIDFDISTTGMDVDADKLAAEETTDWTANGDEDNADGTPSESVDLSMAKTDGMPSGCVASAMTEPPRLERGGEVPGNDLGDAFDAQAIAGFQMDLAVMESLRVDLKVAQALSERATRDADERAELNMQLRTDIAKLQERLKWTENRVSKLEKQLKEKEVERMDLADTVRDKSDKIADMYERMDEYCDEIDDHKAEIKKLKSELEEDEATEQLRKRTRKEEAPPASKECSSRSGPSTTRVCEPTAEDIEMMEAVDAETRARGMGIPKECRHQEMQERAIAEARAKLPKSVLGNKMPKDLPTYSSIGYVAPPTPPTDAKYTTRNFPDDWATWCRTFEIQQKTHIWVYAFRHFLICLFAMYMKPEEHLPIHEWVLAHYFISDWFAETLSAIHRDCEQVIKLSVELDALSRGKLEYNPKQYIEFMQYREIEIPGIPFVDDAFSVDERAARGGNLLDVLSIPRGKAKQASEAERAARGYLERLFVEVFVTPGYYERIADERSWMIADEFKPIPWPLEDALDATIDEVIETMTLCGVSVAMVDNAWLFGYNFVKYVVARPKIPVGWTREEAHRLDVLSTGVERPPSLNSQACNEVVPRPPSLPWLSKSDRAVHYEFYDWYHPVYKLMRREPESRLQDMVDKGIGGGRGAVRFDPDRFAELNPWTSRKPQPNPSESKGSSSPLRPAPKVDKGKTREQPPPFAVASVSRSHVAHPTTSRHKPRTSTPATLIISTGSAPLDTGIPRISIPVVSASCRSNPAPAPILFGTISGPSRLANISADEPPLNDADMLPYDDAPPRGDEEATDAIVYPVEYSSLKSALKRQSITTHRYILSITVLLDDIITIVLNMHTLVYGSKRYALCPVNMEAGLAPA